MELRIQKEEVPRGGGGGYEAAPRARKMRDGDSPSEVIGAGSLKQDRHGSSRSLDSYVSNVCYSLKHEAKCRHYTQSKCK